MDSAAYGRRRARENRAKEGFNGCTREGAVRCSPRAVSRGFSFEHATTSCRALFRRARRSLSPAPLLFRRCACEVHSPVSRRRVSFPEYSATVFKLDASRACEASHDHEARRAREQGGGGARSSGVVPSRARRGAGAGLRVVYEMVNRRGSTCTTTTKRRRGFSLSAVSYDPSDDHAIVLAVRRGRLRVSTWPSCARAHFFGLAEHGPVPRGRSRRSCTRSNPRARGRRRPRV